MRLTNLPGVSHGLPRTPAGARSAIARYEQANADLPPQARRLLAVCAVGRYFGRRNLEEALEGPLPRVPFRDWAWRYWNVLQLSHLEEHWDDFAPLAATRGIREAARWLRSVVPPDAYLLFLRRAGTNPHNGQRRGVGRRQGLLWTKGGCWRVESPFTRILVQKRHLPTRPHVYRWHRRIGREGCKLIERELMRLVDPDKLLVHEAKQLALDYTATRMQELCGWKVKPGPVKLAWFFQCNIPDSRGNVVELLAPGYYTRVRRYRQPGPWEF